MTVWKTCFILHTKATRKLAASRCIATAYIAMCVMDMVRVSAPSMLTDMLV